MHKHVSLQRGTAGPIAFYTPRTSPDVFLHEQTLEDMNKHESLEVYSWPCSTSLTENITITPTSSNINKHGPI